MDPADLYGKTIIRVELEEFPPYDKRPDNLKKLWFSDGSYLELRVYSTDDYPSTAVRPTFYLSQKE